MGRRPRAAPEGEDPRLLPGPWKAGRHAAAAEEEEFQRPPHFYSTLSLLYLVCVVEGADLQLLPVTFRALEASLGLTPTNLAQLGLAQGLAMSVSAPIWGSLADNGWSRKWLLGVGATGWGCATLALAMVSSFHTMLLLRLVNGAFLGTLGPISQSMVADMTRKHERGLAFGFGQLGSHLGSISCAVFAATVSNQHVLGFEGWRVSFVFIALVSFVLALALVIGIEEPQRYREPATPSLSREFSRFRGYWRIDTFKVMVAQGVVGSIPWSAMSFTILFFQYCGISDTYSAVLYGVAIFCCGLGGLIGGLVADRLALWSPNHGRALAAQFSILCGMPFIVAVLEVMPPSVHSFWTFVVLMAGFGLVASWCGTAVNRPVMADIVDDKGRAGVIAWLTALEGSSSACLGAPVVGLLAERWFGYQTTTLQVSEMPNSLRHSNVLALSHAILWCTIGPWIACFVCMSLLHITYGPDVARVEAASRDSARATTALV